MESSTVKWSTIVCISVVNLSLLLSTIAIGTYISVDVNHVCIRFISKYLNLIDFKSGNNKKYQVLVPKSLTRFLC